MPSKINSTTVETTARDEAFNKKYNTLRELFLRAEQTDFLVRYEVAKEVKSVKEEKVFGAKAVNRMAAKLGYTAENLYAHAAVAEAWPEAEFRVLVERCKEKGARMSFSHFVELAPLAEEVRKNLLDCCFTDNLSVRDLKRKKAQLSPRVARPRRVPSPELPADSQTQLTAAGGSAPSFADLTARGRAELERLRLDAGLAQSDVERLREECDEMKHLVEELEQRLKTFPVRDLSFAFV